MEDSARPHHLETGTMRKKRDENRKRKNGNLGEEMRKKWMRENAIILERNFKRRKKNDVQLCEKVVLFLILINKYLILIKKKMKKAIKLMVLTFNLSGVLGIFQTNFISYSYIF